MIVFVRALIKLEAFIMDENIFMFRMYVRSDAYAIIST